MRPSPCKLPLNKSVLSCRIIRKKKNQIQAKEPLTISAHGLQNEEYTFFTGNRKTVAGGASVISQMTAKNNGIEKPTAGLSILLTT